MPLGICKSLQVFSNKPLEKVLLMLVYFTATLNTIDLSIM